MELRQNQAASPLMMDVEYTNMIDFSCNIRYMYICIHTHIHAFGQMSTKVTKV